MMCARHRGIVTMVASKRRAQLANAGRAAIAMK